MSYESSYDTGIGPFRPNKDRGIWSSPNDFVFACICNAFRMDVIYGIAIVPLIANGGIIHKPNTINMKFVIAAVVLLAVAMGVQSSAIGVSGLGLGLGLNGVGINGLGLGLGVNGLGAHGLGLGVNSLGLVNGLGVNSLGLGVNGLGLGAHGLGLGVNGLGLRVSGLGVAVPQVWNQGAWLGAPAAVNVASHSLGGVSVAQQASLGGHAAIYVAKTRGAIHSAPLAGHINSVASVNVAPAPGTW